MNVPQGGHTQVNPDGSATVCDGEGKLLRRVARPWAYDRTGKPQKTWYEVGHNGDLIQHISPTANALFPILADPTDEEIAAAQLAASMTPAGPAVAAAAAATAQAQNEPTPTQLPPAYPDSGLPAGPQTFGGPEPAGPQLSDSPGTWEYKKKHGLPYTVTQTDPDTGAVYTETGDGKGHIDIKQGPAVAAADDPGPYWNEDGTGWVRGQDGQLMTARRYTENAGNPVLESTDPTSGKKTVLSIGEYGSQVADVFDKDGKKILHEESYANPDDPEAGTTIRREDYESGERTILNYDKDGKLYNSAYTDKDVNVLLKPGGTLVATLINPDADYDFKQIAQSVPQEFGDASNNQPIIINRGDEQLIAHPDGSTTLTDFKKDRSRYSNPKDPGAEKITHADGRPIEPGEAYVEAVDNAIDGVGSLFGAGPYGTWDTWKGLGTNLGESAWTLAMYLPYSMSDAIHGAANAGNPTGYKHPDRESAVLQALTGMNPAYIRTSPGYAAGNLLVTGATYAVPGGLGIVAKGVRGVLRGTERAERLSVREAITPALTDHGYTVPEFQKLMVRPIQALTPDDIAALPKGTPVPRPLDKFEMSVVDSARSAIPPITSETVVQKALPSSSPQLKNILANHTPDIQEYPLTGVGGSVTALQDVLALKTPQEIIDGLAIQPFGYDPLEVSSSDLQLATWRACRMDQRLTNCSRQEGYTMAKD
ncbi:MAG: hypothetical protein QM658_08870 [Gordonia sp. (in: high G+C Gram-positive bacteria)]